MSKTQRRRPRGMRLEVENVDLSGSALGILGSVIGAEKDNEVDACKTEVVAMADTEKAIVDACTDDGNNVEPDALQLPVERPVLQRQRAINNGPIEIESSIHDLHAMMETLETLMSSIQSRHVSTVSANKCDALVYPACKDIGDWPCTSSKSSTSPAPHNIRRRETNSFSIEDVYACEHGNVDKNIVLTDASASRWGSFSHQQTNVGLRTRGLWLNPTLQQPSIGGLR